MWTNIKEDNIEGSPPGKALEHLGVRAFELEQLKVTSSDAESSKSQVLFDKGAGDRRNCDLFSFMPSIATVFFEAPKVLASVDVPESRKWKDTRLHAQPYEEIQTYLGDLPIETWIKSLPPSAWEKLRQGTQAKALLAAVERLLTAVISPGAGIAAQFEA